MALLSAPLTATRGCMLSVAQPLPAPRARTTPACALPCSARPLPVSRATRRSYALTTSPLAARLRGWRRASASDDNSAKDTADVARSEDYTPQADVDDVSDDVAEASAAAAELAAEMAGEAAAQAASVYAATTSAEGMEGEEEVGSEERKGEGSKGAVSASLAAGEPAAGGAPSDVEKESQQQQEQQQLPPPSRPLPRQQLASSVPAVTGLRRTVWGQEGVAPQYPPLQEHVTVDVAVVGAGINGLSVAYALLDKHRKAKGAGGGGGKDLSVVVLEARAIGSGQTGRTTAHLMPWNDDYYSVLERLFGRRRAALVGRSHVAAIDWVERVVREHGIECEFERVDGYLFPHDNSDEANRKMLEELAACGRIGLADTSLVDLQGDPALGSLSSALRFPNAADLHPLKYIQGLASAVTAMGGKIHENTRVIRNSSLSTTLELNTGVRVTAGSVVLATNSPINHNLAVHSRQSAYRTYVVGLAVPKGSVRRAQWWDTASPYHYVRIAPSPSESETDTLIVGGEDHPTGVLAPREYPQAYARLEKWARERWTSAGKVVFRWTGQVRLLEVPLLQALGEGAETDTLIVGGEDHPTGVLSPREYPQAYARLEKWARARWTGAGRVVFKWTGQVYEPVDLLGLYSKSPLSPFIALPHYLAPFHCMPPHRSQPLCTQVYEPVDLLGLYGRNPLVNRPTKVVYIVTGNSGQGMTGGTISGLVVSDLILSGRSEWEQLYDPRRLPPLSQETAQSITSITAHTAQGYAFDLPVVPGDERSVDKVKPGEGALVAVGLHKQAVYRTEAGELKQYSAICPHLKCAVRWNPNDKTFDCPCHGSQFDTSGRVIQGPAKANLSPVSRDGCCG
ncbi:unnamed protein product [Closterium sp. Yama58-4]|nr:unnamed protein product [Closterium sp. Yama58-4]